VDVNTVAVIGAGTMGSGIAQVCAQAGYRTRLVDAQPQALAAGTARILEFWDKGIAKGKTTPAQKQQWVANLESASDAARAAKDADLVIEAVPESLDLKQKVFRQLDAAAPLHAILATNTSSLSVAAIAGATKRPRSV
jgi:3-hydroxybutyryl-CoA dehydrogenase